MKLHRLAPVSRSFQPLLMALAFSSLVVGSTSAQEGADKKKAPDFPAAPQYQVTSPLLDLVKEDTANEKSKPAQGENKAAAPAAGETPKMISPQEESQGSLLAAVEEKPKPASGSGSADAALEAAPDLNAVPRALPSPDGGLPELQIEQPVVFTRNSQLIGSLSGITLFADDRQDIDDQPGNQPSSLGRGVELIGLETPEPAGLKATLGDKYLGKSVTLATLDELVKDIIQHYADNGRPTTHVYVPEQEISTKIKIAVLEGRLGEVKTEHQGLSERPWYDYDDIAPSLSLEPGSIVDQGTVSDAVYGLNLSPWTRLGREQMHPFRNIGVALTPGSRLGLTDVLLTTRDRLPMQFFVGFDNTGTALLGEGRFNAGAVWFDAFGIGLDHQMALQFQTDIDPEVFHAGIFSYQIPFQRWNQYLQFFAAYMGSSVELPTIGVPQQLDGTTWLMGLRYSFGLPTLFMSEETRKAKDKSKKLAVYHEIGVGFDFKSSDSNLFFGGVNVFAGQNEVAQFVLEYNLRQTDPMGETTLQWATYFSPGGLTSNNTDTAFLAARSGGTASYAYSRATLARTLDLGDLTKAEILNDFKFQIRGTVQWANENLIASEQLGFGGWNSVRGYSERLMRGDIGYYLQAELYSPAIHPFRSLAKKWQDKWSAQFREGTDELRFLVFFDYGHADVVNATAAEPGDLSLASFGFGLRYQFNKMMSLRFDYGFQLEPVDTTKVFVPPTTNFGGDDSYGHISLSVNF